MQLGTLAGFFGLEFHPRFLHVGGDFCAIAPSAIARVENPIALLVVQCGAAYEQSGGEDAEDEKLESGNTHIKA